MKPAFATCGPAGLSRPKYAASKRWLWIPVTRTPFT